ncbi:MAG TPA: alcohol dehydrogenase catalytic domain-containing protein [Actinomycetota bacterium]|nr:alcohol dehydrogenase catalytic domain-containing protein [Actinomycetota bacterium]
MRAFTITGPGEASVQDVPDPVVAPGHVVVQVLRAGLCGTDVELFTGSMPYLHDGSTTYPVRIGHEWSGRVLDVGPGVDGGWRGAFVTGDTMIGCGRCDRCRRGRHHVCADRLELGIRDGLPGALAERASIPGQALRRLPEGVDPEAGALVEPAGSALRAVRAADPSPGDRVCVWGSGTLGLLALQFALDRGAIVDVVGVQPEQLDLARDLGAGGTFEPDEVPDDYRAVIDLSTAREAPARAVEVVEPGGRVVLVGIADEPSLVDTRRVVLRDLSVIGILAASAGLDGAIELFAAGRIRTEPLISEVVGLEDVAGVLAGTRPRVPNRPAPKTLVDPGRAPR